MTHVKIKKKNYLYFYKRKLEKYSKIASLTLVILYVNYKTDPCIRFGWVPPLVRGEMELVISAQISGWSKE